MKPLAVLVVLLAPSAADARGYACAPKYCGDLSMLFYFLIPVGLTIWLVNYLVGLLKEASRASDTKKFLLGLGFEGDELSELEALARVKKVNVDREFIRPFEAYGHTAKKAARMSLGKP